VDPELAAGGNRPFDDQARAMVAAEGIDRDAGGNGVVLLAGQWM